jgi:catalase
LLQTDPAALEFVFEAYKHCKVIAASGAGGAFLEAANVSDGKQSKDAGILLSTGEANEKLMTDFVAAIAKHRVWEREKPLRPDLLPLV